MNRFLLVFVTAVVFAAVMLAMQGYYWYRVTQKQKEEKDLARRLGTFDDSQAKDTLFKLENKKRDPEKVGDIGGSIVANLEQLLQEAGEPYSFQALVGMMVVGALIGTAGLTLLTKSFIGLGGLLLGYIPVMLVKSKANARLKRMTEQLPEALELVARSLQAGHGIGEAMRGVAEEMHQPIAWEFGRVYEQNNLGLDFRDCLEGMVARNPRNFDLKIFASSVLLQRETGGNLIEILESIADTVRKRFVFQGKVAALTAEAKFSAIVLGGLPFFVTAAIYFMRPAYLNPLFNDPLGRMMLGFICVWFVLGVFVMRELTKVEV